MAVSIKTQDRGSPWLYIECFIDEESRVSQMKYQTLNEQSETTATAQRNGISRLSTARGRCNRYIRSFSECQRHVIKAGLGAGVPELFGRAEETFMPTFRDEDRIGLISRL